MWAMPKVLTKERITPMRKFLGYLSLVLLVAACGGNGKQQEEELSENEVLMNAVLDKHDEAMARMGEIYNLKKRLLAKVDSLVSANGEETAINELRDLAGDLEKADVGMMDWMRDFNSTWDPHKDGKLPEEETKAYYEDHQKRVKKVADDINSSILAATLALQ